MGQLLGGGQAVGLHGVGALWRAVTRRQVGRRGSRQTRGVEQGLSLRSTLTHLKTSRWRLNEEIHQREHLKHPKIVSNHRLCHYQQHPPERVRGWVPRAGVGADSQWGCWRAEDDGWSWSGEHGWTEELRQAEANER